MSFNSNSHQEVHGKTLEGEMGKMTESTILTCAGQPENSPGPPDTQWTSQDMGPDHGNLVTDAAIKEWASKYSEDGSDPLMASASSDRFGLGSSTSSFGYQRASEMVSMILGEDDLGNSINRQTFIAPNTDRSDANFTPFWSTKPETSHATSCNANHEQWSPAIPEDIPVPSNVLQKDVRLKERQMYDTNTAIITPSQPGWQCSGAKQRQNGKILSHLQSQPYIDANRENSLHADQNMFTNQEVESKLYENIKNQLEVNEARRRVHSSQPRSQPQFAGYAAPQNSQQQYYSTPQHSPGQFLGYPASQPGEQGSLYSNYGAPHIGQYYNTWNRDFRGKEQSHSEVEEGKPGGEPYTGSVRALYIRGAHGKVYAEPYLPNGHEGGFLPESPQEITTPRGWSPINESTVTPVVRDVYSGRHDNMYGELGPPAAIYQAIPYPPNYQEQYQHKPQANVGKKFKLQPNVEEFSLQSQAPDEERRSRRAVVAMGTVGSGSPLSASSPLDSDSSQSDRLSRGQEMPDSSAPHPDHVASPLQSVGFSYQQVPVMGFPPQLAFPGQQMMMLGPDLALHAPPPYMQPYMTAAGDMYLPPPMFAFHPGGRREHHPPKRSGPANDLHNNLEVSYEQFKLLEKERKKTEAELALHNPGKNVSSHNVAPIPRLSGNPSRVDRLVSDSLQEHAKVTALLQQMENLTGQKMMEQLYITLEKWHTSIRKVQARRREEIINANNRHRSGGLKYLEDKDVLALSEALSELAISTQHSRTAQWCALQLASNDLPASCKYALYHLSPTLTKKAQRTKGNKRQI